MRILTEHTRQILAIWEDALSQMEDARVAAADDDTASRRAKVGEKLTGQHNNNPYPTTVKPHI